MKPESSWDRPLQQVVKAAAEKVVQILIATCLYGALVSCGGGSGDGVLKLGPAQVIVPDDQPTIQAGILAVRDGGLVLVHRGTYNENLIIENKSVQLASWYYLSNNDDDINQTIIDGNGSTTITASSDNTSIIGLTIRNGEDGISTSANIHILYNRIIDNVDGIDYESGGGTCLFNELISNSDDGIDLDGATAVTISNNIIVDNADDGIEIRLHPYTGPRLDILITENRISGNQEDGIQIIDYPGLSDRLITIQRNLITDSALAAIGLMANGNTVEDLSGAAIQERIHLFNNTLSGNSYGITGGANLIAVNNILYGTLFTAMRNLISDSMAAYNLFWNNGIDFENSNIDLTSSLFDDPLLDVDYTLQAGSPAIDAATANFIWNAETVLEMQPGDYIGAAPDLGAFESS